MSDRGLIRGTTGLVVTIIYNIIYTCVSSSYSVVDEGVYTARFRVFVFLYRQVGFDHI